MFKSWNLFVIMCSLPSITLAFLLMKLPETPKFLLAQGKHTETINCLKFVHRWNSKSAGDKFPVSLNFNISSEYNLISQRVYSKCIEIVNIFFLFGCL